VEVGDQQGDYNFLEKIIMPKAIAQDKLGEWFSLISQKYNLWVPVEKEGIYQLALYTPGTEFSLNGIPEFSAKKIVFPQTECLIKYSYHKEVKSPEQVQLEFHPTISAPKTVVLGIPPCDVHGITFLEKVFLGQGYQDPYFKARRAECILIALACEHPYNTCFCSAVGASPVEAPGADLLMTRIDNEYVVEILSKRGAEFVTEELFRHLSKDELKAMEQAKKVAKTGLEVPLDLSKLAQVATKLASSFESPYWKEATAGCISCGICTYVCPTCHCFNIADEAYGAEGERLRCWDACMFPLYSLEASGHNPRQIKFQRYRNRLNHKFNYLISNLGVIGCTGCGRCIRNCPAAIDLRQILQHILGEKV